MVENNDMPLVFTMNLESYFRHFQGTGKRKTDNSKETQKMDSIQAADSISQNESEKKYPFMKTGNRNQDS